MSEFENESAETEEEKQTLFAAENEIFEEKSKSKHIEDNGCNQTSGEREIAQGPGEIQSTSLHPGQNNNNIGRMCHFDTTTCKSVNELLTAAVPSTSDCSMATNNGLKKSDVLTVEDNSPEHSRSKKRKIHMWKNECVNYSLSKEGGQALANPLSVPKSSLDTNRGLYPKQPVNKSKSIHSDTMSSGFVSAKSLTGALPSNESVNSMNRTPPKTRNKKKLKTNTQSNLISNYFHSPPKDSCDDNAAACSPKSKMFSPVKNLEGTQIYIIEDSPEQYRELCQTNRTIKRLFNNSQNMQSRNTNKRVRQTKTKSELKCKITDSKISLSQESTQSNSSSVCVEVDTESHSSFEMSDNELLLCEDKYGLLGSGNYPHVPKEEINLFESLPSHVIEDIFCYLPMLDLCLNANRVCVAWNDIISNPKFLPWKKRYFKLKKWPHGSIAEEMNIMMSQNSMKDKSTFLPGLIRFMKSHKPVTSQCMVSCLEKHTKYQWAKELMEERFQDCFLHEDPNPWSLMTVLVIISESVMDISGILNCLLSSSSQCSTRVILDSLYCVATFLFVFKLRLRKEIWNGMQYRLYYALYLFENESVINCSDLENTLRGKPGQQNIMKYSKGDSQLRLTHEQLRICNYNILPGEIIKIVAFAGTGKTSTLVRYTQLRPHMRFLLVVYNKSVKEHSIKTFPANVMCKTGHGLAYKAIGFRYKAANKLFSSDLKVYKVTQILPSKKGENLFIRAKNVCETMKRYFASADPFIILSHTPTLKMDERGNKTPINPELRTGYVEDAKFLWNKMKDLKSKVNMTHDGYLKLYQLSNPQLTDYHCILIDEAQDLTPAVSSILLSQPQAKILVGDPHQQIYSFRGATNSMQQVTATQIFYLTQSFRFGPEIARVAACCLELLKGETKKTLVGNGNPGSILGDTNGQIAIITRTNFGLFNEAVKKCCYSQTEYKVSFIGGTDGFGFDMLLEIYTLMLTPEQRKKEGLSLKEYSFLSRFGSLAALDKYATETMDPELLGKIKIVRSYHHNLPVCIRTILKKCVRDQTHADFLFSTAHKAKGLEFPTVKLTDDFFISPVFEQNMAALNLQVNRSNVEDESNLLYVAVTRAKKALQMSPSLSSMLSIAGENMEYPMSSKAMKAAKEVFKCRSTDADFEPLALTLKKKDVTLSDGSKITGGVLSPDIVKLDKGSWSGILGPLPIPEEEDKK